jgi:hypothetical protein
MTAVTPLLATFIGSFGSGGEHRRQQRVPSCHELRSCVAGGGDHDKELELMLSPDDDASGHDDPRDAGATARSAASAAEVEDAECECCGMSEECTPSYIAAVRRRFSGRLVCGLCAEAVAEEAAKNGGDRGAALAAHMHGRVPTVQRLREDASRSVPGRRRHGHREEALGGVGPKVANEV